MRWYKRSRSEHARHRWGHKTQKDMSAKNLLIVHGFTALALFGPGLRAQAPPADSVNVTPSRITVDNLAMELQRQGVAHWKVVLAQAIVETGWEFDSPLFLKTNNFIGMRVPSSRPSRRIGEHKGYSAYATWQDCVADVKLWQDHFWKGGSREQYIAKIGRVWAEVADYTSHLTKLIAKFDRQYPEA